MLEKNRLIIFTGAGLSAESGLATFRDKGGLWDQYDIDEVCNLNTFRLTKNDPFQRDKIFGFYNLLKEEIIKSEPNLAHQQIALWQEEFGLDRVKLITTNIDDLLERAGCKEVLHVHGDIEQMHCVACGYKWNIGQEKYDASPRCSKCDSRLTKPGVVFFNEQAPLYENMHHILHYKRRHPNDIILVVGSSLQVINSDIVLQHQKNKPRNYSILVNKNETSQDDLFDYVIHGNATDIVPGLEALIEKKMK